MIRFKWLAISLAFLTTFAVAFALGRCTGAKVPARLPSRYDPQYTLPVTVDTKYVPMARDTVRVEVPAEVDTTTILAEYFSKHIYCDTLRASAPGKLGGSAEAIVVDTIAQNVIAGRSVRLTFTPNRLATASSVGVLSTFGLNHMAIMAEYRYDRWAFYAGYNFTEHAPLAGVGYRLFRW